MRSPHRLFLCLALACAAFLTVPPTAYAQDTGGETPAEVAEIVDEAVTAAADEAEAVAAPDGGWQQQVDQAMAKVNGAIAAVFFYPIPIPGTGETVTTADGEKVERKSIQFAVLWLVLGAIFFTARMGFVQLRMVGHAIQITRGKYDDPSDEGEVSHFEALSAALSATVGLGNIAGVAIAISLGGPGATFWMICAGFLGMASKFTECSLGQMYRKERSDGSVMGGAMYYLSDGLKERGMGALGKVLAVMFAILCIGGSIAGGNSFQVNQSLGALSEVVPLFARDEITNNPTNGWIYGLIMTAAVGVVILGGLRRIADVASKIVPAMCGLYVAACLFIILKNADAVGAAFGTIFNSAFTMEAGFGGFVGTLVIGFKRAAFSNEAGVGSAAIAHSAAKTDYPVREGIVALLEPLIDTIIVCTMTALVIVITGAYHSTNPDGTKSIFADNLANENGAALTSQAFETVLPWFPYVLSVAVVLFAFSTMISWSYYGERCFAWLFGDGLSLVYKALFLTFTFLGSIVTATQVLEFGDLMILGMAIPNVLGVVILSGKVKGALTEYIALKKSGQM